MLNSGHVSGSGDAGDGTAHGVSIDYVWRVQSESSAHCRSREHATEPHLADIGYFPSLALFYKPVSRDKERCRSVPSSDPLSSIVPSFQSTLKAPLNLPKSHHQLLHKSYRQNPQHGYPISKTSRPKLPSRTAQSKESLPILLQSLTLYLGLASRSRLISRNC